MKHASLFSWARRIWSLRFIAEILCLSLFWLLILSIFLSSGIQNANTYYQYDGSSIVRTSLPFFADTESEYLDVHIRFALNPLHAAKYVITPDDCIETLTINGREIIAAKGLCLKRPGHLLHLPNLQTGENTIFLRLHDTGGQGGVSMRPSFIDPLIFTLLLILFSIGLWISIRIIRTSGGKWETCVLPIIILLAFVLRMSLSGHGGFGGDIHLNQEWSRSAVQLGIVESYNQQVNSEVMLPNYPPLSIAMFAATGYIFKQFYSPDFDPDHPIFDIIIKLPAIFADLLTIIVVYLLLIPMGGRKKALLTSLLYGLHPAVLHDSTIWGQTDSVFTLFMCLAILFTQKQRWFWVGFMVGSAILFKMQAIIALPVLAIVAGLHWRRWLMMFMGVIVITLPTITPFLIQGSINKITDIYLHSVGYYSTLSLNAYNVWVMLYTSDTGKSATDLFLHVISYRTLGLILWILVILSVTFGWMSAIRNDVKEEGKTGVLMLSAALIAYAFFLFNAEMHERYLFPYMALSLPLVFLGRKGLILYLSSSLLFLLNLTSLVAFGESDRILIQETFGEALPVAVATANVIVFVITWRFLYLYQRNIAKKGTIKDFLSMIRHWSTRKAFKAIWMHLSR